MTSLKAADEVAGMDATTSLAVSRLSSDMAKLNLDVLSGGSFHNVKLHNVNITGSSLQNVEIRDSKIICCQSVKNCRIHNCVIEVSKVWDSTISNSKTDIRSHIIRSSITNSGICRSDVLDSKAKNSNFVACAEISKTSIDDSDLQFSALDECTVSNSKLRKTHRINDTTITGSMLSGSWLTNCIVKDSYFDDCQKIYCTAITGSNLVDSRLANCDIDNSKLENTAMCGAAFFLKCSLQNCTVTCPQLALRKFPAEIRNIIFEKVLKWDGKSPALLVALRGDKKLYHEALRVFYDINPLFYGKKEFENFYHNVVAPKYIKNLNINNSNPQNGLPCPRWLELGQVRQLHVVTSSTLLWLGNNWLKTLKTVEKLTMLTPKAKGPLIQTRNKANEIINSGLGVVGKCDSSSSEGKEIWTWEAEPNQTLLWTIG